MRTLQPDDVPRIMRWLKANGVQHEASQIIAGTVESDEYTITYQTYVPPRGRAMHHVKHMINWHDIPKQDQQPTQDQQRDAHTIGRCGCPDC